MQYENIAIVRDGPVAELVLHRPAVRNALSPAMGREIAAAVDVLEDDGDLRVVLVRGEGKAFSAGGDFELLEARAAEPPEEARRAMLQFYRLFLSVRRLRVPTIAVLHGAAIGAGLCFALACDLRIAARGAKLGVNFVRVGLHPGMGATHLLAAKVGSSVAADLLLTGRLVDADEALRIGLVDRVVEQQELHSSARAFAEEIATAAPIAVAQTKASLLEADAGLAAALQREAYAQSICYGTADLREAIAAFRAKRTPKFEGR